MNLELPTHSLPGCHCIATKRHLLFLPELPPSGSQQPKSCSFKDCSNWTNTLYQPHGKSVCFSTGSNSLTVKKSGLLSLIQNFPHTVDHRSHHSSIYINTVNSSKQLLLCWPRLCQALGLWKQDESLLETEPYLFLPHLQLTEQGVLDSTTSFILPGPVLRMQVSLCPPPHNSAMLHETENECAYDKQDEGRKSGCVK